MIHNRKKIGLGNLSKTPFDELLRMLVSQREAFQQELYVNRRQETEKGSYDRDLEDRRREIRAIMVKMDKEIDHLKNITKCLNNSGSLSEITFKSDGSIISSVPNFSDVSTQNIIFDEDTILTDDAPPYIPIVSEETFRAKGYIFDAMKVAPDLYILATHGFKTNEKNNFILVSLDQMILIQDYYYTVANAKEQAIANQKNERILVNYWKLDYSKRKKFFDTSVDYATLPSAVKKKFSKSDWNLLEFEEKEKQYQPVKKYRGKRIPQPLANLESSYMWASYHNMFEAFIDPTAKPITKGTSSQTYAHPKAWLSWLEFRERMKYKVLDIRTQRLIESDTRKLALETSFGISNSDSSLFEELGILVKRQNGSKINPIEIEQIRDSFVKICRTFGSIIGFAKIDNLKISHTGNTFVFASKAVGTFVSSMKTIAVSNKFGEQTFSSVMAHEFAHYIDYLLGKQIGKRFISDNYESLAGEIATSFRKAMNEDSSSDYINATHECFARAMEQFFAIENFGEGAKLVFNQSNPIDSTPYFAERNYCPKDKYYSVIRPMILRFIDSIKEIFPVYSADNQKVFVSKQKNEENSIKFAQLKLKLAKARLRLALIQ